MQDKEEVQKEEDTIVSCNKFSFLGRLSKVIDLIFKIQLEDA